MVNLFEPELPVVEINRPQDTEAPPAQASALSDAPISNTRHSRQNVVQIESNEESAIPLDEAMAFVSRHIVGSNHGPLSPMPESPSSSCLSRSGNVARLARIAPNRIGF
jgi:hypothetical protein